MSSEKRQRKISSLLLAFTFKFPKMKIAYQPTKSLALNTAFWVENRANRANRLLVSMEYASS